MDPTPTLPPLQQATVDRWRDIHLPDALVGKPFQYTAEEKAALRTPELDEPTQADKLNRYKS